MELCINDILYAVSYGLDCIEKEVLGVVTVNHSKRVACLSAFIGEKMGLESNDLLDLATCALLHDNALTEYISDERNRKMDYANSGKNAADLFAEHCIKGEENMINIPTYGDITNVVKYHHEHEDGTGSFGLQSNDIPLYAKIIHVADQVDAFFNLSTMDEDKIQTIRLHLREKAGTLYCPKTADILDKSFTMDLLEKLSNDNLDDYLHTVMPRKIREFNFTQITNFVDMFARIIDYKSEFTQKHSMGLTEKTSFMCDYYGYDEKLKTKLYLAAGLHDIGKLTVDTKILEKPDKLTDTEFEEIKDHARYTYIILSKIQGLDDVVQWASLHHEKLNGAGYPFGKTGSELDKHCRLLACLDIYQALREERPYKQGFSHIRAMEILDNMAKDGYIDGSIVNDIRLAFSKT